MTSVHNDIDVSASRIGLQTGHLELQGDLTSEESTVNLSSTRLEARGAVSLDRTTLTNGALFLKATPQVSGSLVLANASIFQAPFFVESSGVYHYPLYASEQAAGPAPVAPPVTDTALTVRLNPSDGTLVIYEGDQLRSSFTNEVEYRVTEVVLTSDLDASVLADVSAVSSNLSGSNVVGVSTSFTSSSTVVAMRHNNVDYVQGVQGQIQIDHNYGNGTSVTVRASGSFTSNTSSLTGKKLILVGFENTSGAAPQDLTDQNISFPELISSWGSAYIYKVSGTQYQTTADGTGTQQSGGGGGAPPAGGGGDPYGGGGDPYGGGGDPYGDPYGGF